jgi:hypothetical protein
MVRPHCTVHAEYVQREFADDLKCGQLEHSSTGERGGASLADCGDILRACGGYQPRFALQGGLDVCPHRVSQCGETVVNQRASTR